MSATPDLSSDAVRQVIQSLHIPPRPSLLADLAQERQRDNPDIRRVADLISRDVALSAAVLRACNSPAFGLRQKIGSPQQAVTMLGLNTVFRLVQGLLLRQCMSGDTPRLERFWDASERIAEIAALLAQRTRTVPRDEAYSCGLFHEAGVPVMLQKFPNYLETLKQANAAQHCAFTEIEDQHHQTNHALVGYFLARSWLLSEDMQQAILRHHDVDVFRQQTLSATTLNLIGLIQLATHIQHRSKRMSENVEWHKFGPWVMQHFALDEQEVEDLIAEINEDA